VLETGVKMVSCTGRISLAWARAGCGGVLGALMLVQHLAGAGDDFGGQAGEFGDLDAVAFVGGSGLTLRRKMMLPPASLTLT